MESFMEYVVQITLPGYSPRVGDSHPSLRDATREYTKAISLHGETAVALLQRRITRTAWERAEPRSEHDQLLAG